MALTVIEQLSIIKGETAPTAATLAELVEQISLNKVVEIYDIVKAVDPATNPLAYQYKTKLLSTITNLTNQIQRYQDRMIKILISIYSETGDFTAVLAATDGQWITFLQANILQTFEVLASVLPEEKTDYNTL